MLQTIHKFRFMNRIHGPVIILYMLKYIQVHSHIVFAFSFEECHLVELANPFYTVYLYKQINALNEGVSCVIIANTIPCYTHLHTLTDTRSDR